jgi:hypothetical protein
MNKKKMNRVKTQIKIKKNLIKIQNNKRKKKN